MKYDFHCSRCIIIILLAACSAALVSCPDILTEESLSRAQDTTPPEIIISVPAEGSSYASVIQIVGTVRDKSSDTGSAGGINSLSYQVLSTDQEGVVDVTEDGAFSFYFSAAQLVGNLSIQLSCEDWNGNTIVKTLHLLDTEAIPSFAASPGNRNVTISWDDVPLAETYIIHYSGNGIIPSVDIGSVLTDVESPLVVGGLNNGELYNFFLRTIHSDGEESRSEVKSSIPLTEHTLIPHIKAEYGSIKLTWPSIAGTEQYEVLKSKSRTGDYNSITGAVSSTEYEDPDVAAGETYYYRIRPAHETGIASLPAAGFCSALSSELFTRTGIGTALFASAYSVETRDDYAYIGVRKSLFGSSSNLQIFDISDSGAPVLESTLYLGSAADQAPSCMDIILRNNYLFTAGPPDTLHFVEITDSKNPAAVFSLPGFQYVAGLALLEPFLLAADGTAELKIVEIAEPVSDSAILDTYTLSAGTNAYGVDTGSGRIFIAADTSGLEIVDADTFDFINLIPPPGAPEGFRAVWVTLSGNYAYTALGTAGFMIVDITTPGSETVTATVETPGNAVHITVEEPYAFVSDSAEGLHIYDISNPAEPLLVQTDRDYDSAEQSAFHNGRLYTADSTAVVLREYAKCSFPYPVYEKDVITGIGGELAGITHNCFINEQNGTYSIYDRQTGSLTGSFAIDPGFDVYRISVSGEYIITPSLNIGLTEGGGHLDVHRINPDSTLSFEGGMVVDDFLFSAVMVGDYIYTSGANMNYILDLGDMPQIDIVSTFSKLTSIFENDGEYLYGIAPVADATQFDFIIMDTGNPEVPRKLGTLTFDGTAVSIHIRGGYAYCGMQNAPDNRNLQVIDISDPYNPSDAGFIKVSDADTESSEMQANFIFLNTGELNIIDISDPGSPQWVCNRGLPDYHGASFPFKIWGNSMFSLYGGEIEEYSLSGN